MKKLKLFENDEGFNPLIDSADGLDILEAIYSKNFRVLSVDVDDQTYGKVLYKVEDGYIYTVNYVNGYGEDCTHKGTFSVTSDDKWEFNVSDSSVEGEEDIDTIESIAMDENDIDYDY